MNDQDIRESQEKMIHAWAHNPQADAQVERLIGTVPGRWGRMTPLCRALIVEVGRLLQEKNIVSAGQRCNDLGKTAGLIGATRKGSLHTDLAFIDSMTSGAGLASPALFGYTLPNIPLAEAASQFGLTGPVYAIFAGDKPLTVAQREARCILSVDPRIDFIIACEFDYYSLTPAAGLPASRLRITLTLEDRDAYSHPHISAVE